MKMLNIIMCIIIFIFASAMGFPDSSSNEPQAGKIQLQKTIGDFESKEEFLQKNWWVFDNIQVERIKEGKIGKYSLRVFGSSRRYYGGGIGSYLGVDGCKYNYLALCMKNAGDTPLKIRIELYDDDNGNGYIEQDPMNNFEPLFDDRFVYTFTLPNGDWNIIYIPLDDFRDDNEGIGDDIWNPRLITNFGSFGGLLQIQIIITTSQPSERIELLMDEIKLLKIERQKNNF